MDQEEVEACIQRMTQKLVDEFDPVKVILFGSQARGDATWDSDVDLLVVVGEYVNGNRMDTVDAMLSALNHAGVGKDVIPVTEEDAEAARRLPWSVVCTAFEEGRVPYDSGRA